MVEAFTSPTPPPLLPATDNNSVKFVCVNWFNSSHIFYDLLYSILEKRFDWQVEGNVALGQVEVCVEGS